MQDPLPPARVGSRWWVIFQLLSLHYLDVIECVATPKFPVQQTEKKQSSEGTGKAVWTQRMAKTAGIMRTENEEVAISD